MRERQWPVIESLPEDGAWYPIIVAKTQYVALYLEYNRGFKIGDSSIAVKLEQIEWVGNKIEIKWPEESDEISEGV
jgi:hypothetical protein